MIRLRASCGDQRNDLRAKELGGVGEMGENGISSYQYELDID